MPRLSNPTGRLPDRHGVLVVGSGYGGSITAARLAQAGHAVTLLERGREFPVGSFPEAAEDFAREWRSLGNPLGLVDYVMGPDVDVLSGNGLGGTSLVNAAVVLPPLPSVWEHGSWPRAIREAHRSGELQTFFDRVAEGLRLDEAPVDLLKSRVHARSAGAIGGSFRRVPVAVNLGRYDGVPSVGGVIQPRCKQCGNCVSGCNVGSKSTLAMNYLPLARAHGAEIFTGVEVDFVLPADGGGWVVFAKFRDVAAPNAPPARLVLHAQAVILAAGVLGTTGILLRSRERGLALSGKLGHAFSSNGDFAGMAYNTGERTDTAGFHVGADVGYKVGPFVTGMIDRRAPDPEQGYVIQDGCFSRAMAEVFRGFVPVYGVVTEHRFPSSAALGRVVRDEVGFDPKGAVNSSMAYLAMGHDRADGKVVLDPDGHARVLWGGAGRHPIFQRISDAMSALSGELGGSYYAFPRWTHAWGNNPVTVHPLGGCPMGDDAGSGAVDHLGRVFRDDGALHDGLYVADASVIPTSLSINPLFTISALAERIAAGIVAAHAGAARIGPSPAPFVAPVPPAVPEGLQLSEALSGHVTRRVTSASTRAEYLAAEELGRAEEGGALGFNVTIFVDDVGRFIADPRHLAAAEGHVDSGALGERLTITEGTFNLYVADPVRKDKRMIYELSFTGGDGRRYLLSGFKEVANAPGVDAWHENTTLFTSLHEGDSRDAPVVAQGVLHLTPGELLKEIASFRARNCPTAADALGCLSRFGEFFFAQLWDTYVRHRLSAV